MIGSGRFTPAEAWFFPRDLLQGRSRRRRSLRARSCGIGRAAARASRVQRVCSMFDAYDPIEEQALQYRAEKEAWDACQRAKKQHWSMSNCLRPA